MYGNILCADPAKLAAIQHYTLLVDSLLDTEDQISHGELTCLMLSLIV